MHVDLEVRVDGAASPASVEGHDGARRRAASRGPTAYDAARGGPTRARRATASRAIRRSAATSSPSSRTTSSSRASGTAGSARPTARPAPTSPGLPSSATGSRRGRTCARPGAGRTNQKSSAPSRTPGGRNIGSSSWTGSGGVRRPRSRATPSATPGSGSRTSNTASGRPSSTAGPGSMEDGSRRRRRRMGAPSRTTTRGPACTRRRRAGLGAVPEAGAAAAGRVAPPRLDAAARRRATAVGGGAAGSVPGRGGNSRSVCEIAGGVCHGADVVVDDARRGRGHRC